MPKVLCITGMVAAGLIALLFGGDLLLSLAGQKGLAPLHNGGILLDAVFLLCGAALGWFSWTTFREQV